MVRTTGSDNQQMTDLTSIKRKTCTHKPLNVKLPLS